MSMPVLVAVIGVIAAGLPPAAARSAGQDFDRADSLVRSWVEEERIPGAVLLVSRAGEPLFSRAYGSAQSVGSGPLGGPVPMTRETVFDLASITKVMATTMAVMLLVDREQVALDAPVSRYLSDFRGGGKDEITVEHLLTHRSGLDQWQPIYYHATNGRESALATNP